MDILGKYHGNMINHQWYIGVLLFYELLAAWFLMASSLELPLLQPLCEERFALLQGHLWVPETHQQHLRCWWFWRHQNLANKIKQLGLGDVEMQTNAHFVWGLKNCADISTVLGDVRVQCLQASKFGGLEWMRQAVSRRQDDGWGCPQYHEVSTELQYAWSRRDVAPAGLTRGCPKKTSGLGAAGPQFSNFNNTSWLERTRKHLDTQMIVLCIVLVRYFCLFGFMFIPANERLILYAWWDSNMCWVIFPLWLVP